jgi:FkbM family methyltransferase
MSQNVFITAFSDALLANLSNVYLDNVDFYRFPEAVPSIGNRLQRRIEDALLRLARRAGFVRVDRGAVSSLGQTLNEVLRRAEGLERLYQLLDDEDSRRVLVAVLAFWVLGNRRVKLPQNTPSYWKTARHIERHLVRQRRSVPVGVLDGHLNRYDLHAYGFPLCVDAHHLNIMNTFALQQYRYAKNGNVIQAKAGDIVIDGGGCWGDTALYFANKVQPNGSVICFEIVPGNRSIIQANLALNPRLKPFVQVVDKALWDHSGALLEVHDAGPSTTLVRAQGRAEADVTISTLSIDDVVAQEGLDRVDFLKLDIEGSELRALKGAQQTLKRFRPSLAVSLYHSLDDFVAIPAFLKGLELGYEFYLDHFTIHREETVLFGRAMAS